MKPSEQLFIKEQGQQNAKSIVFFARFGFQQ
ncbi:hypothetical protein SMU86_07660 [Streptococcus mutans U2A]|nr:hypothetical protein SMU83_01559 [Streptococcus mutans ST1]EMC29609.1 hypothetical protein SMU86_07660 [Streptococcus mutans U2A]EMC30122.1 hypothetical protein SMU85_00389 [Streptococcus mutans ST6]